MKAVTPFELVGKLIGIDALVEGAGTAARPRPRKSVATS